MEDLRARLSFSLQELETALFGLMARQFAELFAMALELLDRWLMENRDTRRYRYKDREERQLQTTFGVALQFSRRRYWDRERREWVFLLDEVLQLPPYQQVSPALAAWSVGQAALTGSYRAAAESLESLYGHPVLSHESIRQVVLRMGEVLQEEQKARLADPQGQRKVKVLFLEADGLWVSLQRDRVGAVEEKIITSHEGWQPRHPSSEEQQLVEKRQFRTQSAELWEEASRWVYSHYDIDEQTVVVINGDRAPWIRQGVDYFPRALYQVDVWHLKRELQELFGQTPAVLEGLERARTSGDITGATFLAELAQACQGLTDPKKRRKAEALLKDLQTIPEATVDYRLRLAAMGIAVEGFRGLGAAESQMDTFADRVKGRGRSWSRHGLACLMEVLCWRNRGELEGLLDRVGELLARLGVPLQEAKEQLAAQVRRVVHEGLGVLQASVPITRAGRTASGGLSRLFNQVISGAIA